MTINIALVTFNGIVLGCDSLSSIVQRVILPFSEDTVYAKDKEGNVILDEDGMPVISIIKTKQHQIATTVYGGVNKIFSLYQDDDTCVAALTSGLAILGGVTISELAKRYVRKNKLAERKFVTVEEVASDFHAYIKEIWETEFKDTPESQRARRPTVRFLIAGFGANDEYGKVFKTDILLDQIKEQFGDGNHMGLSWSGQADYVERLVQGADDNFQYAANREIATAMLAQREAFTKDYSDALAKAGVALPEGLELEISEVAEPTIPWNSAVADIDFGNLPTQYAVEFVELLVNTQSGMQRFARGVPTVGGRTHIGVLKRGEGLELLNEPNLEHKHTGYSNDY